MKNIISSLKARQQWYQKAINMESNKIDWDNHFDWPDNPNDESNVYKWEGSIHELGNTIDMLEALERH